MAMNSINPATGELLATFETLTEAALTTKLEAAAAAFAVYRRTTMAQRREWLLAAAEILEAQSAPLGRTITLEMGKPLKAAVAEVEKSALGCRYYAENVEAMLRDEEVPVAPARAFVRYEPFGPLLMVMPWNFPFWQAIRFAAPSLMAGNVILLKHASNVPQSALAIESIFAQAGFPPGALQTLLVGSNQVGRLIDHPRVTGVMLTGSEPAGCAVAERAGRNLKKTVLELGGSDPYIVMPSADIGRAADTAVRARVINNGQSCISAKRFIVHQAIYEAFTRRFVDGMAALKVGDPLDLTTDVGPLATPDILTDLETQVTRSVEMGARVLTGGRRLPGPGNYYAPTVLADIPPQSPAWNEELFGPVAALFSVKGIDEAIAIANGTSFGLGSTVWTNDPSEQERFIAEIAAGQVYVNAMGVSDPRLPFGGVKRSGYGRELSSHGIREFVNTKSVWVA